MTSDLAASGFIARVYDAALYPKHWNAVLEELMAAVRASAGALVLRIRGPGEAEQITAGIGSGLLASGRECSVEDHDLLVSALTAEPGQLRIFSGIAPLADFERDRFYEGWMRPRRLSHYLGGVLHRTEDHVCGMVVFRTDGAEPFETDDLELVDRLAPHLMQALEVQESLGTAQAMQATFAHALDQLRIGVIVTDARGRMRSANRKAGAILAQRDGLVLERDGLHGTCPRDTAMLRRLLAEVAQAGGGDGDQSAGVLALSRPPDRQPYHLLVRRHGRGSAALGGDPGHTLIFVIDSEETPRIREAELRSLYGLTPAEANVAVHLVTGQRLSEVAESLGVSLNTVRTHLQHVLEKTGMHRQSDLLRCLLGGVGQIEGI